MWMVPWWSAAVKVINLSPSVISGRTCATLKVQNKMAVLYLIAVSLVVWS